MYISLANFIFFQAGWLACVLGGANSQPWIGTLSAVVIVGYHLLRANAPRMELTLIIITVLLGAAWDSLLVWLNWISYTSGMWSPDFAPHWILALWALFATTLNVSLRWMKSHLWLAMASGAIAGPLAYYAGNRLGAVQFTDPTTALVALAVGWAVMMPLLLVLSRHINGYQLDTRLAEAA